MGEFVSPTAPGMYCLACHYELRGLTTYRCPECGRAFSPTIPATYSRHPSRRREVEESIVQAIGRLLDTTPPARFDSSIRKLWSQLAHLIAENAELRAMIGTLEQILIDKGVISPEELRDRMQRLELFEAGAPPSDDQIATWLDETKGPTEPPPETPSEDLLKLREAVDQRNDHP